MPCQRQTVQRHQRSDSQPAKTAS